MSRVFDRVTFDDYLDDVDLTLLIVVGQDGTNADLIHQKAEDEIVEAWRVCLLIADTSLLTNAEVADWALGDQRYVSLGVNDEDERVAAEKKANSALMRVDKQASILFIRQAFAKGDKV